MVSARTLPLAARGAILVIFALGCRLDNPAFEEGSDELLDDSTSKESRGEGESGTSVAETSASSSDGSETSSSSSSDGSESSSSSEGSSSSSEGSSSSSSTSMTGSDTSTDAVDTLDGLDAPIEACPQILVVVTCHDCITVECCDDLVNSECFGFGDCACVLDCLIQSKTFDFCVDQCPTDLDTANKALALYECGLGSCPGFCG